MVGSTGGKGRVRYSLVVSVSEVYMVKHQKCHGVSDVDKFLNDSGLRLDQVQIVYGLAKFGGDYYVFYDTDDVKATEEKPAEPAKRKPKEPQASELVLTDVTGKN